MPSTISSWQAQAQALVDSLPAPECYCECSLSEVDYFAENTEASAVHAGYMKQCAKCARSLTKKLLKLMAKMPNRNVESFSLTLTCGFKIHIEPKPHKVH